MARSVPSFGKFWVNLELTYLNYAYLDQNWA